jgi:hypothetical protein
MAIAFICIQLALKGFAMFAERPRAWRLAANLVSKASAIAVIGYLLRASQYVVPREGTEAAVVKAIEQINFAMHLGWKFVIVILSLQFLWEISKLIFPRLRLHPRLPQMFLLK